MAIIRIINEYIDTQIIFSCDVVIIIIGRLTITPTNICQKNFSNPSRKRVLELIGKLGETVDFKKPIVLIDYSGSKHTQPQLIKEGVEWLKNPKNWNKLTASEKKLLGINYCDIQNAKIEMHLGVVDSPDSKLHGLDLDFIWKTDPNYAGFSDVEGVKSRFIDPYSYFSGDLRWYGTTSYQQAETWIRQMLLNDAIYYP